MPLYVHLSIGVQWNPRLHYESLPIYLVYPYESKTHTRMAMLSKQDHGRSRVTGSTCETSGLCSSLVRVVGYKVAKHLNLRLGKKTKGRQVENTGWEG
jgi:hypothetical protein